MKRPKLVYARGGRRSRTVEAARTRSDFEVYASYQINAGGLFVGTLKVVRKTDGRLLFPFNGAPVIGPFGTRREACDAAQQRGAALVDSDIESPET
jgi:hypothetical protein